MRISFILDTFGGGGKERRCLQLIQGLNRVGYNDIQVVIINDTVTYEELYKTTAQIIILDRKNKGLNRTQTAKALYKVLKSYRPKVVQAWGIMSAGVVLLVKPFMNFTFIVSYVADADVPFGTNALINRVCNVVCDKVVSNSKAGFKAYNTPSSKSVLIYNGFNEKRFENVVDKVRKRDELGVTTKYAIAMVAAFWQTKDWQCFIDTAKMMIQQRQDITFLGVGKGPQWNFYYNQIDEDERKLIKLLGRRDDVDEIYQVCDLSVLTSLHGEGVSNSIMESMAWGVPVIATNNGGTPEIIEDDVNGKMINKQTPYEVGALITSLLEQPETLSQMSKNAYNTIQEKFLLQKMTADYLNLYKKL